MYHRKHYVVITLFMLGCSWIVGFSIFGEYGKKSKWDNFAKNLKKEREVSYFTGADMFSAKDGKPTLYLKAIDLTFDHQDVRVFSIEPRGFLFSEKGEKINYAASMGTFAQKTSTLELENNVKLNMTNSKLTSDSLNYKLDKEIISARGNVKSYTYVEKTRDEVFINADEAISQVAKRLVTYKGQVNGKLIRKRVYEEGINFASNEIFFNIPNSKVSLTGDVNLKKQGFVADSRNGEIFLENYNKKLKYFVLSDDVKVREKLTLEDGRIVKRRAFAERLEGLMSEQMVVLTGYPKVFQDNDVVRGNMIILRDNNTVVEVDDASTNFSLKKRK